MHRPSSTPQKYYFSGFGTQKRLSKPQSLARPEGFGKLERKKEMRSIYPVTLQTHAGRSTDKEIPGGGHD
jgi:hypothetical protein